MGYTMGMRIKPPTTGQKIANEIEQLRAERDEARREICENVAAISASVNAKQWAQERGWDCYKENNNA
jgi:hypothetical protein